jgi:vacuolar-type H+-ATPase subunit E/Vma4
MPKNKTDNFLKAIKKYANAQKKAMKGETKQLKSERLRQAEKKAKQDSERMKREKLAKMRSRHTAMIAAQTQKAQKELFLTRAGMTDEVFGLASEKLLAYAKTPEYAQKLRDSAGEIAALFGDKDCVLYVRACDLGAAEEFKRFFKGEVQTQADDTIEIGGVRGYCREMAIIADETLDSRLEAQREWLIENAALSVL